MQSPPISSTVYGDLEVSHTDSQNGGCTETDRYMLTRFCDITLLFVVILVFDKVYAVYSRAECRYTPLYPVICETEFSSRDSVPVNWQFM